MTNIVKISGIDAVVNFDPEISLYRGEVTFPKASAGFYASTLNELVIEGERNLKILREFADEHSLSFLE